MQDLAPMPNSERQERRHALHRLSRGTTLALSALVGLLSGLTAVLFRLLVEETESGRAWVCEFLWQRHGHLGMFALIAFSGALGALAAWLTKRLCPEAGGSGIPHVKAVLISARRIRAARLIATKLGAGLLALASGMSLGREGPTVHMGSACGEGFARLFRLPGRTRRALIASGAGAGLAAAFNAPLAGFLFIMEELRRDMSRATYGNALVTAVTSVGVTRLLLGSEPALRAPDMKPLALTALPAVILVGLLAAGVGRLFNVALLGSLDIKVSPWIKGLLVGCLGGVLALLLPHATGGGNALIADLLSGHSEHDAVWLLLILLVVKLSFTIASYATGAPGGIFAPLLCIGSVLGYTTGLALQYVMPDLTPGPERLATVGMAAVLTGSVRAPLTGVVLIVEMTGQYHTLYSLLLGAFISYAVSEGIKNEPIYEALLERDLKRNRQKLEGEPGLIEFQIEPGSAMDRARIGGLRVPEDFLIAVVERDGEVLVPHGSTRLQAGDYLTVVSGPRCQDGSLSDFLDSARAP